MRRTVTAVSIVLGLALGLSGAATGSRAAEPKLFGVVGPDASISFKDEQGNRVTHLEPGAYEVQVKDLSDEHDFHLDGPGVDQRTDVSFVGEVTWQVTFKDGNYKYYCDPHFTFMKGTFTVGTPPPPPPPPTVKPSAPVGAKLLLTVGPQPAITLRTTAGKTVKILKAGRYTFVARDRAKVHNAHLVGAGVNRATGVPFTGTRTWKLTLRKGTLAFRCDQHRTTMRGSVRVV
jgi:plastocyanin